MAITQELSATMMEGDRKYYFDMPSNTRIKKAHGIFEGKTVNCAVELIKKQTKAVIEGEYIADSSNDSLRSCLLFLLKDVRNGQES